jgi:hypothetical protein
MQPSPERVATVAALLTTGLWIAWEASAWRWDVHRTTGPALFFTLPVLAAVLAWAVAAARSRGQAGRVSRGWAVAAGGSAAALGGFLVLATRILIPLSALFFPLMFVVVAVEALLVWLAFLGMRWLCLMGARELLRA